MTKRLGGFVLFLLVLTISACGGDANGKEGEEDEVVVVPVEAAPTTRDTVYAGYAGTATLEADAEVLVVAKAQGVILELLVDEGDAVEQGQVLARLDGERSALELKRARAELAKLENDYKRSLRAIEQNLIPQESHDKLAYDLARQRAAVELAALELSYQDVRSPISGVVSERLVKIGNLVQVHEPLFRVDDFDPLLAVLHVPERELANLRIGQKARLQIDALGGTPVTGEITRIAPVVDAKTGTFKVTVAVQDEAARLMPGMFGRVSIVHTTRDDALTVPADAVITEDRGAYVYRIENGTAHRTPVVTGFSTNGRVEILEGLADGHYVATSGKGALADEVAVNVLNREALGMPPLPEEPVEGVQVAEAEADTEAG